MSQEDVKKIVTKMLDDDTFRAALFEDARETVSSYGFDVSEEELEAFKQLSEEDLSELSLEELEERISKIRCYAVVVSSPVG